jgi:hypothetical protein
MLRRVAISQREHSLKVPLALALAQKQADSAIGDETTKLPTGIHMPDSWKKKLGR